MKSGPIDIKASAKTLKGLSLFGHQGGPVSVIDSDGGKITRIRPYNYNASPDFKDITPWKIEAKGKTFAPPDHSVYSFVWQAYKKRVYSPNRVMYPMKRVDWDPKGERNPQNRGKSPYVRISWDEAAELIAGELQRVKEKYGMSAVLSEADMHAEGKHIAPAHGCANRLLSMLGGYTIQIRNNDSWEGWHWGSKNVWGSEPVGQMQPSGNLWPDIAQNSELLLFWGCDPETTPLGIQGMMSSRLCYWLTELGIKSVYIDPAMTFGSAVHADKWIPVLPNTDAALYLAVAYIWLSEGTYEKEYVKTHAVGYEEFFDYVLGKEDGVPKTPAWASPKCGVPEWTIKALARDWALKVTSLVHGNGGPGIRGPYATEPARLEAILLGMRALGAPGVHQVKMIEWHIHSPTYPLPYQSKARPDVAVFAEPVRPPKTTYAGFFVHPDRLLDQSPKLKEVLKAIENAPAQLIPKCMIHEAIVTGRAEWYGLDKFIGPREEQFHHHKFPEEGNSRIHMVWTDSPCMVTCWNDGYHFVEAMQHETIEFVVAQHPWLENDCILADVILPVVTKFEMDDIEDEYAGGTYEALYREFKACPPVGESKTDFEAVALVAKKIGDKYYKAYTADEISDEELIELIYTASADPKLIPPYKEFCKENIFMLPPDPDIQTSVKPGFREFYEDPAKMPLNTPTRKLEFTSTALKEFFPDDPERPPYPKWIEKGESHDESLSSKRAEKYPLLCISNHGRWRMHAQCDDITWTREIETMKIRASDGYQYEPVWLHPQEAEKRGIKHRDIVKIFNERGIVLGAAYVTERIIPKAAYMDHGARFDPIDVNKIDRGGAINLITPRAITSKNATGMVVSGFLVDVLKVTDGEMSEWKQKYPEAFARKTDPAAGVCLESRLIKEDK
ncbi:MAG: molybdopterin-dependent oxidoreductase [Oscillospiraceae bacterium]|nr:molybdopterin-dependent oxidoreductase [Oscillospiraceae bacterium]